MQLIEGNALANLCDYSFGDHHIAWDRNLTGVYKPANAYNQEFIDKVKEFEGRIMTLFIDNIRLYPRPIIAEERDQQFVNALMFTNNLLALCSLLPNNQFIVFTSHEDTPIDDQIKLPFNVLKLYAVNALYNNERIIPFPLGLQRQIGQNDNRLKQMEIEIASEVSKIDEPNKLLYINCGIGRHLERQPLTQFETNSWITTRFDKDSKFFPYERYNEFLSELRNHRYVACPKGHGYDTHRIWETLYMRRVPIMIDDPYFRRLLQGFPVFFIDRWQDLNEDLLADNRLFEEAQTMDLSKLDLEVLYKEAVKV